MGIWSKLYNNMMMRHAKKQVILGLGLVTALARGAEGKPQDFLEIAKKVDKPTIIATSKGNISSFKTINYAIISRMRAFEAMKEFMQTNIDKSYWEDPKGVFNTLRVHGRFKNMKPSPEEDKYFQIAVRKLREAGFEETAKKYRLDFHAAIINFDAWVARIIDTHTDNLLSHPNDFIRRIFDKNHDLKDELEAFARDCKNVGLDRAVNGIRDALNRLRKKTQELKL